LYPILNSSMGIKIIVTDYSGVLQDDRLPFNKANNRLLNHYGKPAMSMEEWLPKTQISAAKFAQSQGIDEDEDILNDLNKRFYDEGVRNGIRPVLYPDVKETLKFLKGKGISLSILSTHPQENLLSETRGYGILDYFSLVVGSSKDKASDLKEICKKVGGPVLYIDDSMWGVAAGNRAKALTNGNVLTAGITTGYHTMEMLEHEKPDLMLNSFSELRKYF
jgi:phosphoglycolate phosphatase-like HAD superfamily hydrolase